MEKRIVADSCCDLNDELKEKLGITRVPLTLYLDGEELKDDENLDLGEFLEKMKASESPSTACPSPSDFLAALKEEGDVFVVTVSAKLSATYNSAVMAKEMLIESGVSKFVHVFDTLSASVGETLVTMKIFELIKENCSNSEIVEKVNGYIKEMKTFFLLESLDNLVKAGRVSKLVGKLSSALSIKLIMGGTEEGTIKVVEKVRGAKKAFRRLIETIGEHGKEFEGKILGIAHCNCREKAEELKAEVLKRFNFKDVVIVDTSGVSTIYANDGGIVIAF